MPELQAPPPLSKSQPFFKRNSTVIKLFGVGALILVPLTMIRGVYALLMGAIGLFVPLAIVMYVTRKVDWYARDAG
jgi:inner membrane protein